MLITWTEDYATGHREIDADHRRIADLVNMMNDRMQSAPDAIDEAFRTLESYVATHFEREERLMAEWAYPGLAEQKTEHAALIRELQSIGKTLGRDEMAVSRLVMFLAKWWAAHIGRSDMKYVPYIKK
ncbi:MAG: hemerythrin family protein [Alphaproteobacteria bacterium]|nr:hemerythrin family protein [Alphaproteobacteria bacterium]